LQLAERDERFGGELVAVVWVHGIHIKVHLEQGKCAWT
jgi:hypothetical protein